MTDNKKKVSAIPNLGRHEAGCKICNHADRDEIERSFIGWQSPAKITAEFKLKNRASVYRHAHALNLFPKRARNLRSALERIVEQASDVPVNASAVVQAIIAYARINSRGELVENKNAVSVKDLYDRMSLAELEVYAKTGDLPTWFQSARATSADGSAEGDND